MQNDFSKTLGGKLHFDTLFFFNTRFSWKWRSGHTLGCLQV
jgi:hypothetical protein